MKIVRSFFGNGIKTYMIISIPTRKVRVFELINGEYEKIVDREEGNIDFKITEN